MHNRLRLEDLFLFWLIKALFLIYNYKFHLYVNPYADDYIKFKSKIQTGISIEKTVENM